MEPGATKEFRPRIQKISRCYRCDFFDKWFRSRPLRCRQSVNSNRACSRRFISTPKRNPAISIHSSGINRSETSRSCRCGGRVQCFAAGAVSGLCGQRNCADRGFVFDGAQYVGRAVLCPASPARRNRRFFLGVDDPEHYASNVNSLFGIAKIKPQAESRT